MFVRNKFFSFFYSELVFEKHKFCVIKKMCCLDKYGIFQKFSKKLWSSADLKSVLRESTKFAPHTTHHPPHCFEGGPSGLPIPTRIFLGSVSTESSCLLLPPLINLVGIESADFRSLRKIRQMVGQYYGRFWLRLKKSPIFTVMHSDGVILFFFV